MNPRGTYAILTLIYVTLEVTHVYTNNEGINKKDFPEKITLSDSNDKIFEEPVVKGYQKFHKINVTFSNMIEKSDFQDMLQLVQDFLLASKEIDDDEKQKDLDREVSKVTWNLTDLFTEETAFNEKIERNPRKNSRIPTESTTEESFYNSFLDLPALVKKNGYEVKEYTVKTEDGYLLGLHRMWKAGAKGSKYPVLLMHGLLLSSDCWLGAGPRFGLAYLLADDGHDVWIGNTRGNYYSRHHITLDPESSAFWQFCTDEHGKYDLPASIDKVLNETGAEKLNYVGYSQGGAMYFIMCSELPHYCGKAKTAILISPSGRHTKTKSIAFRALCTFYEKNEKALYDAGIFEVLPRNGLVQRFFNFFCRKSDLALRICELVKDIMDAHHPGSFTEGSILSMVSNFPSGTSVHNMARFGQNIRSRSIYKFNYGVEKNLQLYGSPKPPKYNLSAVFSPVVVVYGRNDGLVDISDVKWLIKQLPNVVEAYEVENSQWTHLDGQYSQLVPRVLYPKIKEHLNLNNS